MTLKHRLALSAVTVAAVLGSTSHLLQSKSDPPLMVPPAPTAAPAAAAPDCTPVLKLKALDHAMIGLELRAPCRPDERVVLRHGGLAITAKTSAKGALFTEIPALTAEATVAARFADDSTVEATVAVPEAAQALRFGVQWMADDGFQLHAFEGGADYGGAGHVSAATPHTPPRGGTMQGGWLVRLGDASLDPPLLAEVYTYPRDPKGVEVVVEAAVTEATCARALIGETLTMTGPTAVVTDLTVTMPDCAARGDILALKNLAPDMTLALR